MFSVCDKVFDLRMGFGSVQKAKDTCVFHAIEVLFGDFTMTYYPDGRHELDDKYPTLLTLEQAKALGYEPPKPPKVKVKKYPCLYHNSLVNSKVVSLATYATLEEARSSHIAESYEVIRLITEIPELIEEVEVDE